MKLQLAIILIVVALGLGVLLGMQLSSPPEPVVVEVPHTVEVAGDTTVIQATLIKWRTRIVHDSSRQTDTVITEKERVVYKSGDCEGLHAVADTVLDRELRISGISKSVRFLDSLSIDYSFPPDNSFIVTHQPAIVVALDSVLVPPEPRPLWIDGLVVGGTSLLVYLLTALFK